MAETAGHAMSAAEFFTWQARQTELYELVRGRPVPRAMTGATQRHDVVVVNAIAFFRAALRGGPCRTWTADIAVLSANANIRRPDLTVDCGPLTPDSVRADSPVLVLEVLSPSTAEIDRFEKLEEYKAIPSMTYVLIAAAGAARVMLYTRSADRGWTAMSHIGRDTSLALPELGCTLPLAVLYEDVLPPSPRQDT